MTKLTLIKGLWVKPSEIADGLDFFGNTFKNIDLIKSIPGAKWHAEHKRWTIPGDSDISHLIPNSRAR